MKVRTYIIGLIILFLSALAWLFQSNENTRRFVLFGDQSKQEAMMDTISFTSNGFIVIQVQFLGDTTKYPFLFDTGSNRSYMSPKLIQKYKFKRKGVLKTIDANGIVKHFATYHSDGVIIGNIKVKNVIFGEFDFNNSVVGIIGTNIINQFNWIIDYENKTITMKRTPINWSLFKSSQTVYTTGIRIDNDLPKINTKVSKIEINNVLLDTGFNGSMTLPMSYLDKVSAKDVKQTYYATSRSAFGTVDSILIREGIELQIGNWNGFTPVFFKESPSNVCNLGNLFLQHFVLIIDNQNHVMGLIKN